MKINRKYIIKITTIKIYVNKSEFGNKGFNVLASCDVLTTAGNEIIRKSYTYTDKESDDYHLPSKAEEEFEKYLNKEVLIGEW